MFLAQRTDWNKRSTPGYAQISSPKSILNLEDLLRNRSPEIIPICTVVQSVFPVTILPAFTRAENVVDQTSSVSATCSCPCCVCSFQFVQRPQNTWSANACQIQACLRRFESTLLTTLSPFPAVFFMTWWSSIHGVATLYSCSTFFCLPMRSTAPRIFFAWPSMSHDQAIAFAPLFLGIRTLFCYSLWQSADEIVAHTIVS